MSPVETPAVITKAIEAAERLLRSAGVPYAIQMPDGSQRGALQVAPPRTSKKGGYKRTVPPGFWKRHYEPFLEKLQPGELAIVPAIEGHPVKGLQKVVSAYCSVHFGSGQFMTTVEDGAVQVLRMEA